MGHCFFFTPISGDFNSIYYCWWQPEIGRAPVEVGSLSHDLQSLMGLIHLRWLAGFQPSFSSLRFWTRIFWLFVEPTHLKNISQNGNLPQVGMKLKNIWNHHLVFVVRIHQLFTIFKKSTIRQDGFVPRTSFCIPPGKNEHVSWKRRNRFNSNIIFQASFFRGYVSFRKGIEYIILEHEVDS